VASLTTLLYHACATIHCQLDLNSSLRTLASKYLQHRVPCHAMPPQNSDTSKYLSLQVSNFSPFFLKKKLLSKNPTAQPVCSFFLELKQGTQQPLGALAHLHSASFSMNQSSHKVAQSNQTSPHLTCTKSPLEGIHGFHRAPHFAHSLCIYTWDLSCCT
jgi:hypothetical protein